MSDIQPLMLTAVAGRVSSRSVKRWHQIRGRLAIQQTWISLTRLLNSCIFSSWVRLLAWSSYFPCCWAPQWAVAAGCDGGGCSITGGKRGFMALSHDHLPKRPFMMWGVELESWQSDVFLCLDASESCSWRLSPVSFNSRLIKWVVWAVRCQKMVKNTKMCCVWSQLLTLVIKEIDNWYLEQIYISIFQVFPTLHVNSRFYLMN